MPDLCIQIHPHRSPDLDVSAVRSICEEVVRDITLVHGFSVAEGNDGHAYVNLMFSTDRIDFLWGLLQHRLYRSGEFGFAMQRASIATCEGKHGWDDYLLLRHFDSNVERNELS
jgi:hypothetical protein